MYKIFASAVITIFFLYSCSTDSGTNSDNLMPTFSSISTQIFNKRCSCHLSEAGGTPFLLTSDVAYENLVLQPSTQKPSLLRVQPGDPDNSYLYLKITKDTGDESINGSRMPKNGPPYLDADQIDAIRQWIADGAKNN